MINVAELEPGARVALPRGVVAEVVENPRDGMWVFVRYVTVPDDPAQEGTEELCHADQVLALA